MDAVCLYCRKPIGMDITGGWFSLSPSDSEPWQCPCCWDQVDRRHVPEVPYE